MMVPKPARSLCMYGLWFLLVAGSVDPIIALPGVDIPNKIAYILLTVVGGGIVAWLFSMLVVDRFDLWLRRATRDPLWLMTDDGKTWLATPEGKAWQEKNRPTP